jgi:hypothetical protein
MVHFLNLWMFRVYGLILVASLIASPVEGQSTERQRRSSVSAIPVTQTARPEFVLGNHGEFGFNTGVVQGVLRKDGKSRGLSTVVHGPTGASLDGGSGLLGYYRVFTANHRYGSAAWNWPSTARLLPDGAVAITWPAAEGRPFAMGSVYRWHDRQTLDLVTTVMAQKDLADFEVFLASYFHASLTTPLVYAQPETENEPRFMVAEKSAGDWQMFLRHPENLKVVRDGRWRLPPNPVEWVIQPPLAQPICLRRGPASDVTVMLMAPKQDCFAVSTPYRGESHYSLYLSLFGYDIKAGQAAVARVRLVVAGAVSDREILGLYDRYQNK